MIDPHYVQTMARYNAWQNAQLTSALETAPAAVLKLDRRAFWGSILGTLNHILWADQMWLHRLAPKQYAALETDNHTELTPTIAVWSAERFRVDGQIKAWAARLRSIDLQGNLTFTSQLTGKTLELPIALAVTHLFTHQTHHRGQVHAMVTAAGMEAPVTDIVFMPEDA